MFASEGIYDLQRVRESKNGVRLTEVGKIDHPERAINTHFLNSQCVKPGVPNRILRGKHNMAIKGYANSRATEANELLTEKLAREERAYRADRLVEKWSKVPEIGKGIKSMGATTARNLAILLENQTRTMSRMNEAQLSNNFYG